MQDSPQPLDPSSVTVLRLFQKGTSKEELSCQIYGDGDLRWQGFHFKILKGGASARNRGQGSWALARGL